MCSSALLPEILRVSGSFSSLTNGPELVSTVVGIGMLRAEVDRLASIKADYKLTANRQMLQAA